MAVGMALLDHRLEPGNRARGGPEAFSRGGLSSPTRATRERARRRARPPLLGPGVHGWIAADLIAAVGRRQVVNDEARRFGRLDFHPGAH